MSEPIELALCESEKLVLRLGVAYVFRPQPGCPRCTELAREARSAYGSESDPLNPFYMGRTVPA